MFANDLHPYEWRPCVEDDGPEGGVNEMKKKK
jgi:hypothetical protein